MKVIVDLRNQLPPVRDQGDRPTCLAFAISSGHSYQHGLRSWLSPEYISYFARKKIFTSDIEGLSIESISSTLSSIGQPYEEQCPYMERPARFLKKIEGTFKCMSVIARPDFENIWDYINNNNVAVACTGVTRMFFSPKENIYIDDVGEDIQGHHAVLLIGTAIKSNCRYLFIMNSWGGQWAKRGCAWITESFFNKYASAILKFEDVIE
ncbi:MAG: hypothetical protein OXB88_01495 [Bacteriovoracales bacterium]|nr:hypothetical protein [Bacteriovoracales bacterium]